MSQEHVGQQFRAVPNIKPTPGSQGTLFQGGYPTNWHRGYSPERKNDVIHATIHSGLDPQTDHASRSPETAAILDTVARSTVPIEHLRSVGWYSNSDVATGKDAAGTYNGKNTRASIHISPGAGRDMTPIHEIGHHASRQTGTEHSAYDTPARRGTEEGYAENYAETHFRDRRGRPQKSDITSTAWTSRDYETKHGNPYEFKSAFDAKRKESPQATREQTMAEFIAAHDARHLPKNHVPGQVPLLDKITSGPDARVRWDYHRD